MIRWVTKLVTTSDGGFFLIVLMALLGACDRQPAMRASTTQAADGMPAFLSHLQPVAASLSRAEAKKLFVCLFTRTDCPVSNSYAPPVRRMYEKFSPLGVGFYLVYPDP